MTRTEARVLPAAVCVWTLAILGVEAGPPAAIAACSLVVVLVLTGVLLSRGGEGARALLAHLGIVVLAGTLLFPALTRHDRGAEALADAASQGLIVELTVIASADAAPPSSGPDWARTGQQVMARTVPGPMGLGRARERAAAALPVLVRADGTVADQLAPVEDGQRLRLRATVADAGSLIVLDATEVHLVGSRARGAAGSAFALRESLREQARAATAHLPADEAALVRGMTTGDTAGMSARTEEIMRRAGISHLVAVSGANIALVLAAVLGPLLLVGVRRRPRLLIAAAVMGAYVWLVGDEPSVLRAATMAAPLLIARFVGVCASPVAALAMTVTVWSAMDPATAASIGFLLSALATAAILLAAPPLARVLTEISRNRLGRTAALAVAVPLVAQLVCTPVLILLTPEISLWAVPVNLMVAPIVAPTTVVGLLALVLGALWTPLAPPLNSLAAGGAHLVLIVARTADALPGSRIPVPDGAAGALLAIAVVVGAGVALAARRVTAVRWIVAVVLVIALAPGIGRRLPLAEGPDWTVALCAVGQGDAMLLRPAGATVDPPTVLVDTGPEPAALRDCLDRLGVERIDLLVLTHPHRDHTGGRAALRGDRLPEKQWVCPLPEAAAEAVPGVPALAARTGTRWQRPGLSLRVLWPASADAARTASAAEQGAGEGDAANDCSVVLSVRWADGTRLLALGDLEPAAQQRLAALDPGPADLVKVAHHGSRFQHAGLYRQLSPQWALVTVGRENDFGHPTEQTLDLMTSLGAQVLRTDVHGTVVLTVEDGAQPRSVGPAR